MISSVTILETVKNRTDNSSVSGNTTLINFQSNQDATNYLNAFDKSDYSLISTSFKTSDAPTLKNVTGHVPSVYAEYLKTEGSIFDLTFKVTVLMQYDNIIAVQSGKVLSLGTGVSSASSSQSSSIPALLSIPSKSVTATITPTAKASATPTPKIATVTRVWAPAVMGPDTIANPGPGMGAYIRQGGDWYCRAVVNAADGTHPCGSANWYIDDQAAGGVWSNNGPGVNGLPGCSAGMGGGFAMLELHTADTLKLSVGYHTLKCDFLGNGTYAPAEWVGRIYIAAPA